ncbi:MAG TPA: LysR family transcriptional regulator, partial [Salinarimonas sp.]|nr:LysR family transcriptional regulator [Salinarimonas sp.]
DDGGRSSRPSVRELEVLHAVITTRKTTAAAQRLGVSQPAVSRAIGALEARLGRELFLRDGGRLVPTADAYALDAEAAPIFAALARLENWPRTPSAGSLLRIMSAPTITHAFLAPLIRRFLAVEPDTRIQMEIGRSTDAVAAVADGTADLGVVDVPNSHAGVRAEPFRQSVAHVMLPSDHPLAAKDVIGPGDLDGVPLVAVTRRFSARARIERAFADQGVEPRFVIEAGTLQFLADMVKAGLGVAVINPFPIAYITGSTLTFRPFEPTIDYETSFLFPATGGNLPVARRFVDFVRQEQMSLVPAD